MQLLETMVAEGWGLRVTYRSSSFNQQSREALWRQRKDEKQETGDKEVPRGDVTLTPRSASWVSALYKDVRIKFEEELKDENLDDLKELE